jgi:DNA-binding MarR family transcriptional regulator
MILTTRSFGFVLEWPRDGTVRNSRHLPSISVDYMTQQREGGFLIAKIHQVSGRIFARILKEYGVDQINPAQGRILFVLWKKDEIPISKLARRTQLDKSTLTSMLDHLEEAGHITRIRSKKDRRKILIKLTEKDKSLQKVYNKVSDEMTGLFYRKFSHEEIDEFESYLKRILANLAQDRT